MKSFHYAIIAAIIWQSTSSVIAMPQLPTKCEAFKPQLLLSYTVKESQLNEMISPQKKKKSTWGQTGANTGRYWFAFSDRSNNATFETPEGERVCGQLDFNEKVCRADINNDFALVYVEELSGVQYPTISRKAKCKFIKIK